MDEPARRPWGLCLILLPVGLFLTVAGIILVSKDGSFYYPVAGVAVLSTVALLLRRERLSDLCYATFLLATLGWSIWEVGTDPWALMPRVVGPALLGLWWLLPRMPRQQGLGRMGYAPLTALGILTLVGICFTAMILDQPSPGAWHANGAAQPRDSDWRGYGGEPGGARYAALDQINVGTVRDLSVAWVHHSHETLAATSSLEATPLKIGGSLFTCTGSGIVIALNAATGGERWRYAPRLRPAAYANRVCRGVAFQTFPGAASQRCASRVFSATLDARLIALDAETGRPCAGFGKEGMVNLLEGLGTGFPPSDTYSTSGPLAIGDLVVVGDLVIDNQKVDMPSGVIRAYDAITGKLRWAFDMGRPDDPGPPPPGGRYTPSTPNAWAPLAADPALGLIYVPLGNPSPDFFGAYRRPFDERYGSAIVALGIKDGRPRWVFQAVHHDLWDYDLPAQPSLIDLKIGGRTVPALVQPTKHGDIFVLDRRTGRPLLPVRERPVPAGPGLEPNYARTQPASAIALGGPPLVERDMWGITPLDQLVCRLRFRSLRYEGDYTPPSTVPTLVYPAETGVMNWGGASVDPVTGTAIVNTSHIGTVLRLVPRREVTSAVAGAEWRPLMLGTPYAASQSPFLSPLGIPCNRPSWGDLVRVDLRTGRTLWSRRFGTSADSGPFGIPTGLRLPIGVPSVGGSLTTAGGLVFIGATLDRYFRAFDERTGAEVWRWRLPAGAQATPMAYMADGRQYVVVSVGGHALLGTRQGDTTYAFALPRR